MDVECWKGKKTFYSVPGTVQSVNDEYSKEWKNWQRKKKTNIKKEDNQVKERKNATFYCLFRNKFIQSICSAFNGYLMPGTKPGIWLDYQTKMANM